MTRNATTAIILFEADCRFCNACRRFVERRDIHKAFSFVDIASPQAQSIARNKNKNLPPSQFETIVVVAESRWLEKFEACLFIIERIKRPWPILARVCRIIPKPLGDFGYDLVARHRRFLGRYT